LNELLRSTLVKDGVFTGCLLGATARELPDTFVLLRSLSSRYLLGHGLLIMPSQLFESHLGCYVVTGYIMGDLAHLKEGLGASCEAYVLCFVFDM